MNLSPEQNGTATRVRDDRSGVAGVRAVRDRGKGEKGRE